MQFYSYSFLYIMIGLLLLELVILFVLIYGNNRYIRKLFHILRCNIGCHSWITTAAVFRNDLEKRIGIAKVPAQRVCKYCGKVEHQDIHCIGLNPPEYLYIWGK